MSIENPEKNLGNKPENAVEKTAEISVSSEKLSDEEKNRIFEDAKRHGAWFPMEEGLRLKISKSKLILYAEEVLVKKVAEGDINGLDNFRGALEHNGFTVSEGQDGKLLVNLASSGEKVMESPEKQFEKAKAENATVAIKLGLQLEIPREKIEEYAKASMAQEISLGNYLRAINILRDADVAGLNIGSFEEIEAVTSDLFNKCLQERKYNSAIEIARMKWGDDSEQYKKALEVYENDPENMALRRVEEKKERRLEKWSAKISKDATFKDLFDAVDDRDEELRQSELFMSEVWDNFDQEICDEILDMQSDDIKAVGTKVVEFFEKYGYSKKDIETFLPVKFKRERR